MCCPVLVSVGEHTPAYGHPSQEGKTIPVSKGINTKIAFWGGLWYNGCDMSEKIKLKRDKYKSARGGYSRLLSLRCRKCDSTIASYQKDGPGNLRRLYMDRIVKPKKLVDLQKKSLKEIKPLKCGECGFIVGMPYIYQKEKRKAFRMFQDAIVKRIIKT